MNFPIVLKQPETDERSAVGDAKLYYRVAADGVYQVREMATHRSVTRAEHDIPGLEAEAPHVDLYFPHLPRALIEDVLVFFDETYRRYGGEAIVLLFFDAAGQHWSAEAPPQRIRAYNDRYGRWTDHRLDYGEVARPEGAVRFGSIHSHADLLAYASHTDCQDERYEDGLHVVFGSFKSRVISRSASFVAGGTRFALAPEEVLEEAELPDRPARSDWMDQVEFIEERWQSSRAWHEPLAPETVVSLDRWNGGHHEE